MHLEAWQATSARTSNTMAALTHGLHLQRANHGSGESSFKKLMRESQSSQRCGSNIEMVWHFCRSTIVISAVAENDARYVVPSGGVANGGPERWNSTHMCRCSSPLARPATALMAWRPATARQASPSRRVRAQWQR